MRLVTDMIEFCTREMPLWHPISISGYHIREAGSNAAQELAFTLADGFTYVEWAIQRGLDVDDFAPRLSFFFNAHLDSRRSPSTAPRAGSGRGAARALMADAVPHADRRRLADGTAARSQHRPHRDRGPGRGPRRNAEPAHQLLRRGPRAAHRGGRADRPAHTAGDRPRAGVVNTIDPLGGSYYLESVPTGSRARYDYFRRIDELGGMEAIKQNFPQREIAEASFRYQGGGSGRARRRRVNRYLLQDENHDHPPRRPGARDEADRAGPGRPWAPTRPPSSGTWRLCATPRRDDVNLMPVIVDARDYVTMGEMCDAFRAVWACGARHRCSERRRRGNLPASPDPSTVRFADTPLHGAPDLFH